MRLKFIGPVYAKRLNRLNIFILRDLIYHIPFRYDDLTNFLNISEIKPGEKITIRGQITEFNNIYTKYGKKIQKGILADDSGTIEVIWYNQPFLINLFKKD